MSGSDSSVVRLAHLSDVHLKAPLADWRTGDWFSKRLTGWLNAYCGTRRRRFENAAEVLASLVAELREQRRPDCIVFSGDATMLGFADEMNHTAAVFGVGNSPLPHGFAVPGNHDYYVLSAERSGAFEKCFPWQEGERVDGSVYPFARRVGHVWLVGVNSAKGRRWPWDATGQVDAEQLQRLRQLLDNLLPGPRILVTHFPVADERGQPERPWHLLRNVADLAAVAERGGVCLWLHGHRHHRYHLDDARIAPFPIICAGSATERGIWNYFEYTISGRQLHALERRYNLDSRRYQDVGTFELQLRA